ncbi:unnamed protein product [Urochloa humidicola]
MFLVLFLLLLAPPVHVAGQQGFLSIDCGLDDKHSGYTDTATGIVYVSDEPYVDSGDNLEVAAEYKRQWRQSRRYQTVRSFPSGERNCYSLPTEAGAKYLVRLNAAYGNHDGKNDSWSLEFDVHLGAHFWNTLYARDGDVFEAVFVAWAGWAPVCLVNTGRGTPFVSVLELRQLGDGLYPPATANQALNKYRWLDMGTSTFITRFPDDRYDRVWLGITDPKWANKSTTQTIQQDPTFIEPLPVLQTAVTTIGNDTILNYSWQKNRATYSFMVFLHFADFQNIQVREFDIYLNGNRLNEMPYSPQYLAASSVCSPRWYTAPDGNYNVTLTATANSVLPPMLNALEVYTLLAMDGPATYPNDFDAIMAIKFEYGVKKNWMGDPCLPTKYAWVGIKCSNTSDNTTRITSIDLSNSSLHGVISNNFTLLSALENLDLSYNKITGPIPDSLPTLPSLRVLNLSGNHLSGQSLCKNFTGSLVFRYDSDGYVCDKTINQSKNRAAVIAISVVVPVLVIVVLLLAYYIWREKKKPNVYSNDTQGSENFHVDNMQISDNRRFTYKELKKFTNNFKQFIGKGGFGAVYYGRLENGTEVAVKMRSESSSHGLPEFLAEVQCLSKVHHRNLVSLVGYCWENDHLALVYEYMSEGNLCAHLRGKNGVSGIINWGTRVRVLLEAAQGLDYLHKGCNLPIIHRDVKTSNILLGQKFQAKIADFGLSKIYLSDSQTHISTTAAGTAGYIDPEYYQTGRLAESSDVYSFGVVLLEVATGEPAIVPGQGFIVQRVKDKITTGGISSVADARLQGSYDVSSMRKVVDTALMCTSDEAAQRPTMSAVVVQLKESLALEEARES